MKRNYRNPIATANYRHLTEQPGGLPFSFVYGGKQYRGFSDGDLVLKNKTVKTENEKESAMFLYTLGGVEITLRYTDSFEDLLYHDAYYNDPERVRARDARGVCVRNIDLSEIECAETPVGVQILGLDAHPIENVRMQRCRFAATQAENIADVRDYVKENVRFD